MAKFWIRGATKAYKIEILGHVFNKLTSIKKLWNHSVVSEANHGIPEWTVLAVYYRGGGDTMTVTTL